MIRSKLKYLVVCLVCMERVFVHQSDASGVFSEFLQFSEESDVLLLAPHGGAVEAGTDVQAELVGNNLCSDDVTLWGTRGVFDGNFNETFSQFHTTSETHPLSYFEYYLDEVVSQEYGVAVSFHATGRNGIVVGGNEDSVVLESLCDELGECLGNEIVRVAGEGCMVGGQKPNNFVNYVDSDVSVHLEQNISVLLENVEEISGVVSEWVEMQL